VQLARSLSIEHEAAATTRLIEEVSDYSKAQ
jgi:hypothetical protein